MSNQGRKLCSEYLTDMMVAQDSAYQKKSDEKLRQFLSLSSGKASCVSDLISNANVEILHQNRQHIWNWLQGGSVGSSPLLPPGFPCRFCVMSIGPICAGVGSPAPSIVDLFQTNLVDSLSSQTIRRVSAGEYMMTLSISSYEVYLELSVEFGLKKSEWYEHSFWGSVGTKHYGSVQVNMSVTTLREIASSQNSGLKGVVKSAGDATELSPMTDVELVSQRLAWFESELALIQVSILSAAVHAASQSSLRLRRDAFYQRINPSETCWRGESQFLKPPAERTLGGDRLARHLPLGIGVLSNRDCYQYLQNWFSERVVGFSPMVEDPGVEDELGRLHFLLATCMLRQETMAAGRSAPDLDESNKSVYLGCGGLERDIGTKLSGLSVYDPTTNPGGIFICPTYIPSHAIRLCEWLETHLPELADEEGSSLKLHFVHIDSEGEFFQLHTETAGSLIIFTGMNARTESKLMEEIAIRFRVDLGNELKELAEVVKAVCREFTLSRPDLVFGGDRAACPIASMAKSQKEEKKVAWMDSDITAWYWWVGGVPGRDFFCLRSIDRDEEARICATAPLGFKNLLDCGPGQLCGQKKQDACICKRLFGADWLRQCTIAHPQVWHGYPQSGAVASKSFARNSLHWTILYYAVADLVKARMLTHLQNEVDIEIVTPVVELGG